MRLTAKVQYAFKAVLELALRYNNHVPTRLNAIAEAQNIPKQFLVQLFIRLKNAGLVKSVRGVRGGYVLAKVPSKISLAHLVKALDESFFMAAKQVRADDESGSMLMQICNDINLSVIKNLEKETFENLVLKLNGQNQNYII